MMKKLVFFFSLFFLWFSVFAQTNVWYQPIQQDSIVITKMNKKITTLLQKHENPILTRKIIFALKQTQRKSSSNQRLSYILGKIIDYTSIAFGSDFKRYINEDKWFSLRIPKKNNVAADERDFPVTIVEKDSLVYIRGTAFYDYDNKFSSSVMWGWIPRAILIQDISSEAELEKLIDARYNPDCTIAQKTLIDDNIFAVQISSATSAEPGAWCFINYRTVILYSEEKWKVAIRDIWQAVNFAQMGSATEIGLDWIMTDSFLFLD